MWKSSTKLKSVEKTFQKENLLRHKIQTTSETPLLKDETTWQLKKTSG